MTVSRPGPTTVLPDSGEVAESVGEIAALLWQERDILERLLFSLATQQLVLSAGATRWLPRADAEVQNAADTLQEHEVLRAAEVELLAHRHQLPADVTLADLAACAPQPWPTVLADHREALRVLMTEVDRVTAENCALLAAGVRTTREALEQVGLLGPGAPRGRAYDPRGAVAAPARRSVLDAQA